MSSAAFEAFDVDNIDPLSLLLQTGYLTIKSLIKENNMPRYRLDFPNHEVLCSFNACLLSACTRKTGSDVTTFCYLLSDSMKAGEVRRLRTILETFFADISRRTHHREESWFRNILFAIFRLLGRSVRAEEHTGDGRVDAAVQTDDWIYLFEFKLNGDKSALKRIKEKERFKPYLLSGRRVMLIAADFDTDTGKLSNWKDEELIRS